MRSVWAVCVVAVMLGAACGDDDGVSGTGGDAGDGGTSGGTGGDGGAGAGGVGGAGGDGRDAGMMDGSALRDATSDDDADVAHNGGDGGSGGAGGTGTCGAVNVQRLVPTVQLVIDGSGSMDNAFGNTTRWEALHDALLGEDGVVSTLESSVRFGMSIYQIGSSNTCPLLTGPAPALQNAAEIEAVWLESPGGATPTGEAMETVVASMSASTDGAPQVIVLATDGAPNGCSAAGVDFQQYFMCLANPNGAGCAELMMMLANDGYARTLQAAIAAQAKGINVYVIDLSEGGINQQELQKIANVGVGRAEDQIPPAPLFAPNDPDALGAAIRSIVRGAGSCIVAVEGQINDPDHICETQSIVTLNSQVLDCHDPHGWRAIDTTHIEILGNACIAWRNDPIGQLEVTLACNAVTP